MFDQLHPVVEIIRNAFVNRPCIAGINEETFERLYPALAMSDAYTCEHFLQRMFDDI
tara:strand:- start:6269 stop:6439 length:171 start_codon:yes stop_codon:yes gene_type:complete